jgi:hypothetical protein
MNYFSPALPLFPDCPPLGPLGGPPIVILDVFVAFENRETDEKTEFKYKIALGNDLLSASWLELRKTIRDIKGVRKEIHELKEEYKLIKLVPE